MKFISKKIASVLLVAALGAGCGDVEELNINPNQPTIVPAANLVTQGQYSLADLYWGRGLNFEFGMLFVQQIAQNEYTEEQRYTFQPNNFDGAWISVYANGLNELQSAKDLIDAQDLPANIKANQLAVIDIMMAFGFQMATDIWGDIPYSEALTGENTQPAFDRQEDIYAGLIARTQAAVNSISVGSTGLGSSDIIFNGDMDKWQKFGNALLLRMGMRIADANSALASSTVSSALSGNIISSVGDEATLPYRVDNALANPFFRDTEPGARDDFRVSERLVDIMLEDNDPRLTVFADPTATGDYVGIPYGLVDNAATELKQVTSDIGAGIENNPTAPATLLRYSEVEFLRAEAIERGFVSGDASSAYAEGIRASMNEWGFTDEV